jgi:hypothetical protein
MRREIALLSRRLRLSHKTRNISVLRIQTGDVHLTDDFDLPRFGGAVDACRNIWRREWTVVGDE